MADLRPTLGGVLEDSRSGGDEASDSGERGLAGPRVEPRTDDGHCERNRTGTRAHGGAFRCGLQEIHARLHDHRPAVTAGDVEIADPDEGAAGAGRAELRPKRRRERRLAGNSPPAQIVLRTTKHPRSRARPAGSPARRMIFAGQTVAGSIVTRTKLFLPEASSPARRRVPGIHAAPGSTAPSGSQAP